MSEKKP